MPAIRITVNGQARELDQETSLADLLRALSLSEKRVAVELNGRVATRPEWPRTAVSNGDRIEVVHFVGGG